MSHSSPHCQLSVNLDHVATLRQQRRVSYPSVQKAMEIVEASPALGVTLHLREDRRHIQDGDLLVAKASFGKKLNLEMSLATDIVELALRVAPQQITLVPERREELTTEGGLDVKVHFDRLKPLIQAFKTKNIHSSLFIEPDVTAIRYAAELGADAVELHTGAYANAVLQAKNVDLELQRLRQAASIAHSAGLRVYAGHGLTLDNVGAVAMLQHITELNIGHGLVSHAVFVGLTQAIADFCHAMSQAHKVAFNAEPALSLS